MKCVIDRIEEKIAVIFIKNKNITLEIPIEILPKGIKEGDWFDMLFKKNSQETFKMKKKNEELLEKLKRGEHL